MNSDAQISSLDLLAKLMDGLAKEGIQSSTGDLSLSAVEIPHVEHPRINMTLKFSLEQFRSTIENLDEQVDSLWPDRPKMWRAVQLMLVHVDEEVESSASKATDVVLTLVADSVRVSGSPEKEV